MSLKEQCGIYGIHDKNLSWDANSLYQKMLDKSFLPARQILKKNSISIFGSPVIYSLKYDKSNKKGVRLIAEPGGNEMTIPQRIAFCLQLLEEIEDSGSYNIINDVNKIADKVYPEDKEQTKNWLGGMWIGMDTADKESHLKIYMNLRHQPLAARWQRIADVIVMYSKPQMEPVIRFIMENTWIHGTPVGIGIGAGNNGTAGIRIYISFQKTNKEVIDCMFKRFSPEWLPHVNKMVETYEKWFSFLPQTVMTFDFLMGENKYLLPEPMRLKVELSSCTLRELEQSRLEDYIEMQINELGISGQRWMDDIRYAKSIFSGIFCQYISFGVPTSVSSGKVKEHITVYFEPVE